MSCTCAFQVLEDVKPASEHLHGCELKKNLLKYVGSGHHNGDRRNGDHMNGVGQNGDNHNDRHPHRRTYDNDDEYDCYGRNDETINGVETHIVRLISF